MKQFSAIIIGAGGRGETYTSKMYQMPDKYKIVGMADPREIKRKRYQDVYGLSPENCFADWRDILSRPKFADIAVIATMDKDHYEPAMKAIELGYHLLLEKPIAQTEKECIDIANAAKRKGVSVIVCHVLRYTPFYKKIKSIIDSGMIGKVMSLDQIEAVGDLHFSHSYIRGNWHSEKETTPMILAKCCHDLDIVQWLIGRPCKRVSSFGDLSYFCPANAPVGAPIRCSDGTCPEKDTCPYNCYSVYIDNKHNFWARGTFKNTMATHNDYTDQELIEDLKRTDYGLCVFHANNDMPDHQSVNMEFEGGAIATLNLNAFNAGGRYTRIYGTKGELYAFASDNTIKVHTFSDNEDSFIPVQETEESIIGGHGGGDFGIVYDMYDYLNGTYTGCSVSEISTSVSNHLIGFAAEEARHNNTIVSMDEYNKKYGF